MKGISRDALAIALANHGLKKALIAVRKDDGFSVNTMKVVNRALQFDCLGFFVASKVPIIGRVGGPDPKLTLPWKNSMTFYGKWFDQLADSDTSYALRRSIVAISREKLLEQIQRDDDYGLIGSYYSVFLKIMDVKRRVPLILFDGSLVESGSFPVILPAIADQALREHLERVLRLFARKEASADEAPKDEGIEVDELSSEEFQKYFPPRR